MNNQQERKIFIKDQLSKTNKQDQELIKLNKIFLDDYSQILSGYLNSLDSGILINFDIESSLERFRTVEDHFKVFLKKMPLGYVPEPYFGLYQFMMIDNWLRVNSIQSQAESCFKSGMFLISSCISAFYPESEPKTGISFDLLKEGQINHWMTQEDTLKMFSVACKSSNLVVMDRLATSISRPSIFKPLCSSNEAKLKLENCLDRPQELTINESKLKQVQVYNRRQVIYKEPSGKIQVVISEEPTLIRQGIDDFLKHDVPILINPKFIEIIDAFDCNSVELKKIVTSLDFSGPAHLSSQNSRWALEGFIQILTGKPCFKSALRSVRSKDESLSQKVYDRFFCWSNYVHYNRQVEPKSNFESELMEILTEVLKCFCKVKRFDLSSIDDSLILHDEKTNYSTFRPRLFIYLRSFGLFSKESFLKHFKGSEQDKKMTLELTNNCPLEGVFTYLSSAGSITKSFSIKHILEDVETRPHLLAVKKVFFTVCHLKISTLFLITHRKYLPLVKESNNAYEQLGLNFIKTYCQENLI